ncbi:alternative ribosome rescue aminoacyl-tRNA hydrolase ArfB [Methylococcus mesophilus]|uniref:alternative ribosome rescue aminoacyl-tRNA hydrolase ArfB n=1 Tax=Methylococcus mesophilus TaxID=2993564 RepID=UPI00224AA5CF|nr:alternative ribosome rescue aminoacyl-tRNA hydrolase ArfB [Methylococcus mesophilus]UZR27430.1 alternative ribosome rescue aminoacyl-tRNA hydrolase ArfB [Methylococcus mesophilus]
MERLRVNAQVSIPLDEIEISFVRSQGAGGQNVNKLATAAHLRFDIAASSLPETCKTRLLDYRDRRISAEGIIVIKAQRFRTQEKNREDALARLRELILAATAQSKPRKATRPTLGSQKKRLENKSKHGQLKKLRGGIGD